MSDMSSLAELEPARAQPIPIRSALRPGESARLLADRRRSLAAQPAVARSLPALGALAALGVAVLVWIAFSGAPNRHLFEGLADAVKAAVLQEPETSGIPDDIDPAPG